MTTLLAIYNSDGCVGRCDAKCYNAKHPDCECVCGGKNHGAGLKKATENMQEVAGQWLEAAGHTVEMVPATQPTLF